MQDAPRHTQQMPQDASHVPALHYSLHSSGPIGGMAQSSEMAIASVLGWEAQGAIHPAQNQFR